MKRRPTVALTVLALSLVGCSAAGEGVPDPGADGGGAGDLVVGSFGGDYDSYLEQSVLTYSGEYGVGDVTLDSVDVKTRKTQLITEKEGESGSWDVVMFSDRDIPDLIDQGMFQKLDPEQITNTDQIVESLPHEGAEGFCAPHTTSPISIIYNSDEVDMDLTSWESIFTDEFLDEAGIESSWTEYYFYASAILQAGGDPGSEINPDYDKVAAVASKPFPYGSPAHLGQGLMSGEVNVTIGPRARGEQWARESGEPIKTIIPDEGTFTTTMYGCIPANANNPEMAHDYLDALLDARGQEFFAENFFYAPVTDVELAPELDAAVNISAEEADRIWTPDLGELAQKTGEFRKVWEENS